MAPKIYGDYVVWHCYYGFPSSYQTSDIMLFDLKAWKLIDITPDVPLQYNPDIHENNIVWHDQRNGNWEIYLYDISTETEKRITYEDEQSFCPQVNNNKIIYYYHDRITDDWSARLYNIDTKEQIIVDDKTYCDSHPDVFGDKVVWVSRANYESKIHVIDYSLAGFPGNVKIDFGADGTNEFVIEDESMPDLQFNESELIEAINEQMISPDFRGIIPIKLSFKNAGRIMFSNLSIIYEIPTIVELSSFSNSMNSAICVFASSPIIANSSLSGNNVDLSIISNSIPIFRNTTYSKNKIEFNDDIGKLLIQNFLSIEVTNITGAPVNTNVCISMDQKTIFNKSIGQDGIVNGIIVDYILHSRNRKVKYENIVLVDYEDTYFENNSRTVNMKNSHCEYFVTDTVKPEVSQAFPANGQYYGSVDPIISIHITDNNLLNISSINLFVEDFAVWFDYETIESGYNISYNHPIDFQNGQLIRCRIIARDLHNNVIDYSWEFPIDIDTISFTKELDIGWNLISVPIALFNNSIDYVFNSISGNYDCVMTYDSQDNEDHWKRYVDSQSTRNEFSEISIMKGYWINVTEASTLRVIGKCESQSIPLYTGWNLVGYPSLCTETTMSDALWGTGADSVEVFDPSYPYLIRVGGPQELMMPGSGDWVHVSSDTFWVVEF